jgi:hypothetical protein
MYIKKTHLWVLILWIKIYFLYNLFKKMLLIQKITVKLHLNKNIFKEGKNKKNLCKMRKTPQIKKSNK